MIRVKNAMKYFDLFFCVYNKSNLINESHFFKLTKKFIQNKVYIKFVWSFLNDEIFDVKKIQRKLSKLRRGY